MTHTEVFGIRSVSQEELSGVQRELLGDRNPIIAPLVVNQAEELGIVHEDTKAEETQSDRDVIGEHDELDPLEAGFNTETGASVTEAMKDRLNGQFKPQGIEILDVVIQQITVPDVIQMQMSNKTYVISQNAEQRMQQKYDLLTLRQQENIKTLKQRHRDLKDEMITDGKLRALREEIPLEVENARGKATLVNINTQKKNEKTRIKAESDREVQQIRDNTMLNVSEFTEKSKVDAAEKRAVSKAKIDKVKARAELECSKMAAKGDKALFKAEGISAPLNRALNEHTTALKKFEAQLQLASNEKLIVAGMTGGDAANRLILTEAVLNDAEAKRSAMSAAETSAILSEIAVASGSAQVRMNMWGAGGARQNDEATTGFPL
jgi:hypothetical protein